MNLSSKYVKVVQPKDFDTDHFSIGGTKYIGDVCLNLFELWFKSVQSSFIIEGFYAWMLMIPKGKLVLEELIETSIVMIENLV